MEFVVQYLLKAQEGKAIVKEGLAKDPGASEAGEEVGLSAVEQCQRQAWAELFLERPAQG